MVLPAFFLCFFPEVFKSTLTSNLMTNTINITGVFCEKKLFIPLIPNCCWGHCGRDHDHMVVAFTTMIPMQSVPITTNVVSSNHGEVYMIQNYVIKFVSNLRQVGGFLWVLGFPPPKKNDRHDITEILLKVALNTINHRPFTDYIKLSTKYFKTTKLKLFCLLV